ncbi:MAG: hypothetical protein ABI399_01465, partial [Bauldia sp.]
MPSFFIQLRCIIESRSVPPNQACERSFTPLPLMLPAAFSGHFAAVPEPQRILPPWFQRALARAYAWRDARHPNIFNGSLAPQPP